MSYFVGKAPKGYQYLKQCEERLRARERGKMDRDGWWAFGWNQNLDQFEQAKIMLPDYHDAPAAALDLEGRYYSITAYCLTLKEDSGVSLPVVSALLNSRLLFWVLSKIGTALQRGFVRFMPQYLDQLPIVVPSQATLELLEQIARDAMAHGFASVEMQLNALVEDAYGLTSEERQLLRATRPIRDPLDVLEAKNRGIAVEEGTEAAEELP